MLGQSGSSTDKPNVVRSAMGITIADAMANLQQKTTREIFWGHMKVLILGEEFAKEGIREQLDFFGRDPEPRMRTHVFVGKGKASEILAVVPSIERPTTEPAKELVEMRYGMSVTLKQLLQMLKSEVQTAALPWLEKVPGREDGGDKKVLCLNGIAVFKKDKMIGHIDDKTTRGVMWLRNEIKRATITVEPQEGKGFVSLDLLRSRTNLKPNIENGKWLMTVEPMTEDDIVQNGTNLNMMDAAVVKMLEQEVERDLEDRIRLALDDVQNEMKADIIGFADAFHRKYPDKWESVKDRWDKIFPEIEVKVVPNVHIRRSGMFGEPVGSPKKSVR